jgi:hypothetical protein
MELEHLARRRVGSDFRSIETARDEGLPLAGSTSRRRAATCDVGPGERMSAMTVAEPISVTPPAGTGSLRYVAAPDWSAASAVAHAPLPPIGSKAWPTSASVGTDGAMICSAALSMRTSPAAISSQLAAWNGPADGPSQSCVIVWTPWCGSVPTPRT